MGHFAPAPSREKKHLTRGFFQSYPCHKMRFDKAIVGAATITVASAASHRAHHPNQRTFHERQGFGLLTSSSSSPKSFSSSPLSVPDLDPEYGPVLIRTFAFILGLVLTLDIALDGAT